MKWNIWISSILSFIFCFIYLGLFGFDVIDLLPVIHTWKSTEPRNPFKKGIDACFSGFFSSKTGHFQVNQLSNFPGCIFLRLFQHTFGTHTPKPLPTGYKGIPFIVGCGDCLGCAVRVCCNFLGIWFFLNRMRNSWLLQSFLTARSASSGLSSRPGWANLRQYYKRESKNGDVLDGNGIYMGQHR